MSRHVLHVLDLCRLTEEIACSSYPGIYKPFLAAKRTEQRVVLARGPNGCFDGTQRTLMKLFTIILGIAQVENVLGCMYEWMWLIQCEAKFQNSCRWLQANETSINAGIGQSTLRLTQKMYYPVRESIFISQSMQSLQVQLYNVTRILVTELTLAYRLHPKESFLGLCPYDYCKWRRRLIEKNDLFVYGG